MAVFLAFAKNRGARSVVRSQDSDETVGVLCQKDQLGTANVEKKKNENTPPPATKKMRLFPEKLNTTSFICFLANVGKKKGYKKTKVSPLGGHTGVAQTWQ